MLSAYNKAAPGTVTVNSVIDACATAVPARVDDALRLLDDLPGPRWRGSWAVWLWVVMTLLTLAQQGGIVGGVGQALAMAAPLTESGAALQALQEELVALHTTKRSGLPAQREGC